MTSEIEMNGIRAELIMMTRRLEAADRVLSVTAINNEAMRRLLTRKKLFNDQMFAREVKAVADEMRSSMQEKMAAKHQKTPVKVEEIKVPGPEVSVPESPVEADSGEKAEEGVNISS